jgi:probable HAF family extracellular repeat protein
MLRQEQAQKSISLHAQPRVLGLLLIAVLACQTASAKSPPYRVTDLGTLGYAREGGYVAPTDINNRGEVVGIYHPSDSYPQSFISSGGKIRQLGDFFDGDGLGINDLGQAVGVAGHYDPLGNPYPFIYSNGKTILIPGYQGYPGYSGSAEAINNRGQVTGWFSGSTANLPSHAFLYTISTGKVQDLGAGYGISINNLGQVAGVSATTSNAVIYSDGKIYDLGVAFNPTRINDLGQIVGYRVLPGNVTHAVLYNRGKLYDLGTLPGTTSSLATGINNLGQIVGSSDTRTFIYEDGQMYDLSALVLPHSGWVLGSPNDPTLESYGRVTINDFGQIATNGNNGIPDSFGWLEMHVLLLTPTRLGVLRP